MPAISKAKPVSVASDPGGLHYLWPRPRSNSAVSTATASMPRFDRRSPDCRLRLWRKAGCRNPAHSCCRSVPEGTLAVTEGK